MDPSHSEKNTFNLYYILLFLILVIGVPLLFTPLTRSVFEVGKLTLLRVSTLIMAGIWLFESLFKQKTHTNTIQVAGFTWKKTGLELPTCIWIISILCSTIFSTNIHISIFGSYDRWEGVLTAINYIALFWMSIVLIRTKEMIKWILWALLFAAALSGLYGIYQSLGFETISWSMDPALRVFASINNPVHFCAYMGMCLPLSIGFLHYFNESPHYSKKTKLTVITIILGLTGIIFYSMFLSYSRATWLGFLGALSLQYLFLTKQFNTTTRNVLYWDFFATLILMALSYLIFLFKIHTINNISILIFISLLILSLWGNLYTSLLYIKQRTLTQSQKALVLGYGTLLIVIFLAPTIAITAPIYLRYTLYAVMAIGAFFMATDYRPFFSKLIVILMMMKLQYVGMAIEPFLLFTSLLIAFIGLSLKQNTITENRKTLLLYPLYVFMLILITSSSLLNFSKDNTSSAILENSKQKLGSFSQDALQGTARTSMWKSSFPWIKDYWLFGSGLDTIKYKYPHYRRSEYGKLEGGHNFTPDRLHNEYLNTLASKGLFGFVSYYIVFLGAWLLLILKSIFRHPQHELSHMTLACLFSAFVYFGQVFFNFGVVATLCLLYIVMGLGVAIHQYLEDNEVRPANEGQKNV